MRSISLRAVVFVLGLLLASCGDTRQAMKADDYNTIPVKFPNGEVIRAEQMVNPQDLARGMMFRDRLEADRGMLFFHSSPGRYPYWMYQVRLPLDIIWMDTQKRIVQIVHQAPPCPGPAEKCPSYGGGFEAAYVLEVAAGAARANGLKPGMQLEF